MKDLRALSLLVWLLQLGLSTVAPLVCCMLGALWLHNRLNWGEWVIWVGALLGTVLAIDGFRTSLKMMSRLSKDKKPTEPPPVSFNDHD